MNIKAFAVFFALVWLIFGILAQFLSSDGDFWLSVGVVCSQIWCASLVAGGRK